MQRNQKFILGIGIIVSTVGFLVYTAVDQTKMYMVTVAEVLAAESEYQDTRVRIAGEVAKGSVNWDADTRELHFVLDDMDSEGEIPVVYSGLLPDMFAEGRRVVVEGPYRGSDTFQATSVLTSCPSKYEAEDGEGGAPHGDYNAESAGEPGDADDPNSADSPNSADTTGGTGA